MLGAGNAEMPIESEKGSMGPIDVAAREGACQHASGDRQARLEVGSREQHGEFVAADAERPVATTDRAHRDPSDGREQVVTGRVAALIVDLLEVVDVHEQQ